MASNPLPGNGDHYDAIIVGGRPAGSTLATRLGRAGLRVLLLERAVFPEAPPASAPAIYASTMRLLDEIGADESDYARGTPPIRRWVTEFRDHPPSSNRVPDLYGRDYGYAIDRARFDDALWRHAARLPTVATRQIFAVTDLLWHGGRVSGVRGRSPGQADEAFTAGCVVGADGRFSLVARKVGARVFDERADLPTTLYYAYWKSAEPYDDDGPAIHMVGGGQEFGIMLMDSADGWTGVVVEGRAPTLGAEPGRTEALYMAMLRSHPRAWRRLANAERVTEVRGMRRVGNFYRAGGGPGWALTGDAVHQKDPLDGQGIYDAVFTAKALSQALVEWKQGNKTWEQAVGAYEAAVREETYPMYVETLRRVKRDLYTRYPEWMVRSVFPLLIEDPEYKRRAGLLIVRGIDPAHWMPRSVVNRALVRGALSEIRRRVGAADS